MGNAASELNPVPLDNESLPNQLSGFLLIERNHFRTVNCCGQPPAPDDFMLRLTVLGMHSLHRPG